MVIPKLGAFIVKDDNQTVVFSELLRSDDGVLRGLIKGHGVGDIEAAGVIDRFVFEVRHTLDRHMPYKIGNWGTLRRNETGKIIFMSFRTPMQQSIPQQTPRPVFSANVATQPAESKAEKRACAGAEQANESPKRRVAARRKPDIFMIVAVVVVVAAICAIAYGLFCNKVEDEPTPFPEIENVEPGFSEEFDEGAAIEAMQN